MTENVLNIYQRINRIMAELDYIEKGSAKVNGQYRFVSHDSVAAKVHPLLVKHGVTVVPSVCEYSQEGNRTTVKLYVCFVNCDDPKDYVAINQIGYGIDSGDKGPGKAISYAYKYALLKTFCLETGDDPDNDASATYEPEKCHEFEMQLPEMSDKERQKLKQFLEYSSEVMKKHVEDIKREALKKMPEFMSAFKNWNTKVGK